jgi:DNA-binding XRE family transcriptional regulator
MGLTQAELAEKVNVSRQAVSKWEMGTAVPDIDNMLSLSKCFSVSIDYLVDDKMESELDAPVVKATAAVFKISFQNIIVRLIVAFCIVVGCTIAGIVTDSFLSAVITLSLIGVVFLLYFGGKFIVLYFSNRKPKQ